MTAMMLPLFLQVSFPCLAHDDLVVVGLFMTAVMLVVVALPYTLLRILCCSFSSLISSFFVRAFLLQISKGHGCLTVTRTTSRF